MAKKIRRSNRRRIVDLLLGWNLLSLVVAMLVIAAFILLFGLDEPGSISNSLIGEMLLFGVAILAILLVALFLKRLKRTGELRDSGPE